MGQKRIVRIVSLINATNRSEKGHQPAQLFDLGRALFAGAYRNSRLKSLLLAFRNHQSFFRDFPIQHFNTFFAR